MGGTFSIDLSNFQSIGSSHMTFTPGITLLVGQSNSGKSATLRAIKALLTNPSRAKTYIKHGKDSTNVEITFEGNNVSWSRSNKESSYNINGEEYSKVGNKTLFDLLTINGFVRDDDDNIMNIEGELELPFPFDRTPSQLFKLFENIFCVADSATIIKTFKDDESQVVKDKGSADEKLARLNARLTALDELSSEVNLPVIKEQLTSFSDLADRYLTTSDDIATIARCEEVAKLNIDEVNPPTEFSMDKYLELFKDLSFLCNGVIARQKFYKSLPEPLPVPKTLDEYLVLSGDISTITKASELSRLGKEISENPPTLTDTLSKYLELLEDIRTVEAAQKASVFTIVEPPSVGNSIDNYLELLEDYNSIVQCYEMCKEKRNAFDQLDSKIHSLNEELSSFKVCPLCGHVLNQEEVTC